MILTHLFSVQVKNVVVRGGLANFLSTFTTIQVPDDEDEVPIIVGDCDEVERYLRLPQIPLHNASGHDQDILYWWKEHSSNFPYLSKMARQFLAAPASSAGAERLFSGAGKMHDDQKKSTDKKTLENQLMISMNFPNA